MHIQNYFKYSKSKINVIQQPNHTHMQCEKYAKTLSVAEKLLSYKVIVLMTFLPLK